jgi:hypothetical protein
VVRVTVLVEYGETLTTAVVAVSSVAATSQDSSRR